ncbi:MAG TPA: succinate dehydrogenase, partial [Actinomycetota bacterium]|nr:succinate dehydrogenase [Actinomycetota bacterium]
MATAEDIYRKHRPQAFSAERRPSSLEVWWWFFMRISGVVLLFLVLIHLYIMHLIDGGVERVGFAFVSERWRNVG